MSSLILEDGSKTRQHPTRLMELLSSTTGVIRIASGYVTNRELLRDLAKRETRLLLSLLPMDVISGATSLEALGWMVKSGVQCRVLPNPAPKLHAKVYIFGNSNAVVTSANLTNKAFHSNIEVGTEVNQDQAMQLQNWFDQLWDSALQLNLEDLAQLKKKTAVLRRRFAKLKEESNDSLSARTLQPFTEHTLTDSIHDLFENAKNFFICNTDRRHGARTLTDGYEIEQEMYNRGLAMAWEKFNYPSHMLQVEPGDAILMYAKRVGIVGLGMAIGKCLTLPPKHADRLFHLQVTEWRIPVKWLAWTDDESAFLYKSPNMTFWNITDSKYDNFRQNVLEHFAANC